MFNFFLAYLDPGTGSYLIQILIAGLLGMMLAVKGVWINIKAFFARLFGRRSDDDTPKS
jgi:hypothetical protein